MSGKRLSVRDLDRARRALAAALQQPSATVVRPSSAQAAAELLEIEDALSTLETGLTSPDAQLDATALERIARQVERWIGEARCAEQGPQDRRARTAQASTGSLRLAQTTTLVSAHARTLSRRRGR